jgi:hypothetical protein
VSARTLILTPVLILMAAAGCATQHQRYDWGSYDPSLYGYYKNPAKVGELTASLAAVIDAANANHAAVPPGIYAEYGYLQLELGKNLAAVNLFEQEESHWPESRVFMDRMIKVASTPVASTTTSGSGP